jgi:hypothetical protein
MLDVVVSRSFDVTHGQRLVVHRHREERRVRREITTLHDGPRAAMVLEQGANMSRETIEMIEIDNLEHVHGGAGSSTSKASSSTFKTAATKVGKGLVKGFPAANAVWAGYDAYQGYSSARSKGASVGRALGEAGLEGVNSFTWGASNYVLGRDN